MYKTLDNEMVKTKKELNGCIESDSRRNLLENKLELLNEISKYIKSFAWLKRKTTIDRVRFFINSGYDYTLLCQEFNISETTARNSVNWSYRKLRAAIGENTLSLVKQDRIQDAKTAFYVSIGKIKLSDFLMKDLLDILPDGKFHAGISLEDCRNELLFLQSFSTQRLEKIYGYSDDEKLEYLLHILSGSSKKADTFRVYLIGLLCGKLTVDEFMNKEQEFRNGYSCV